jgi:hypothetical protein
MNRETAPLLETFEALAAVEKRAFAEKVPRGSLPFDSGPH